MSRHEEQYNRIKRWRFQVENPRYSIYDGRVPLAVFLNDVGHSFFTCCWHLWEWIKNDDTLDVRARNAAEAYARNPKILKVCESICVASKHVSAEDPRVRKDVALLKVGYAHDVSGPGPSYNTVELIVRIGASDKKFSDFAEECIREWDAFFLKHGISIPSEESVIHFDVP